MQLIAHLETVLTENPESGGGMVVESTMIQAGCYSTHWFAVAWCSPELLLSR